uniref:Uncharacterized protein n=1 Tax=Tetranychus urticae TaxID=32264 RepID=T1K8P9_TETUR
MEGNKERENCLALTTNKYLGLVLLVYLIS